MYHAFVSVARPLNETIVRRKQHLAVRITHTVRWTSLQLTHKDVFFQCGIEYGDARTPLHGIGFFREAARQSTEL